MKFHGLHILLNSDVCVIHNSADHCIRVFEEMTLTYANLRDLNTPLHQMTSTVVVLSINLVEND